MATDEAATGQDQLAMFKDYLAEPKYRIKLDDVVSANVRSVLRLISDDQFPLNGPNVGGEAVVTRLKAYEDAVRPILENAALLGRWATTEQLPTLSKLMMRTADNCVKTKGGATAWLNMRWYPLSLLAHAAGVAALSAENYAALAASHLARIETETRRRNEANVPIVVPLADSMSEMEPWWKSLPGYERLRVAGSEYMFKILRPMLDELLFLGGGYEEVFDRYEILRALMYADLTDGSWAPVGRFGWKHYSWGSDGSPFAAVRAEAEQQRDQWGPIRVGLFRGTYARFEHVAKRFETEHLNRLGWH